MGSESGREGCFTKTATLHGFIRGTVRNLHVWPRPALLSWALVGRFFLVWLCRGLPCAFWPLSRRVEIFLEQLVIKEMTGINEHAVVVHNLHLVHWHRHVAL